MLRTFPELYLNRNDTFLIVDAKGAVFVPVDRLKQASLIELVDESGERAGVVDAAWL